MEINTELFLQTLPVMGKGMLGIFIVTGIIVLAIMLLGRLPSGDDENK